MRDDSTWMCVFAPRGDLRSFRACHSPRRRAPRAPPPRRPNPQPITRCESTLGQVWCAVLEILRADGHPLSGWNSSTIDPKHARKRRHISARAALRDHHRRRLDRRGQATRLVGEARRGLQQPPRPPQPPPSGGSVATAPGAERGQPGAGRSGDLATRSGRDRETCDLRRFVRNAMFVHALLCEYVGCG